MIEDINIITGSPEQVKPKLEAYLNGHPNAAVLSSAVHVQSVAEEEEKPEGEGEDKKPKKQKKPKQIITLVYTVGRVFA